VTSSAGEVPYLVVDRADDTALDARKYLK